MLKRFSYDKTVYVLFVFLPFSQSFIKSFSDTLSSCRLRLKEIENLTFLIGEKNNRKHDHRMAGGVRQVNELPSN